jgi:hypothetical protein
MYLKYTKKVKNAPKRLRMLLRAIAVWIGFDEMSMIV